MKHIFLQAGRFIKNHYRFINKGIIFLLSLALIVMFSPKDIKFKYEYHKGKPWLHPDLIAPFDFSIYKTESELQKETDEVLKNLTPYFYYNQDVENEAVNNFSSAFEKSKIRDLNIHNISDHHALGIQLINLIFNKGIVNLSAIDTFGLNGMVYLIKNKNARLLPLDSFYTIQQANLLIKNELTAMREIDAGFLMPLVQNVLEYNIIYDEKTTLKNKELLLSRISLTRGLVQNGEKIISKGELITPEKFILIESLKTEYLSMLGGSSRYHLILAGQIMITSLLLLVVFLFIYNFRKPIFENNKKLFFIILQIVLMVIITKLIVGYEISLLYAIPVCITPIIIRAFFDTRLAIFVHVITVIIISSFAPNSYEFVLYHLTAGIVAVLSIVSMSKRSQLFFTALYIFFTYVIFYIGFMLIFEGSFVSFNSAFLIQFAISSVLNLLAFPLIFLYEKMFGYPTDFSLLELSNSNNPLMRELAGKAPGTFQHSVQVANMAEEAAYQTGGNALLVRVGALYHDVGKIDAPYFFTENQARGSNPHHDLSYKESAKFIISHVIKGIKLARKYNIPEHIIDFIRTHHGTKKTDFFYSMQLKEFEIQSVNEADFRYNGPLPFSKETAILMMADAVEAASRSLTAYNDDTIDTLVDKIIDSQINDKQFVNSDLTFKDVNSIRKIFKNQLKNIYHVRIAYPTK